MTPTSSVQIKAEGNSPYACNWKKILHLAVVITGVAASIFTTSIFGVLGFTLFGITSFYFSSSLQKRRPETPEAVTERDNKVAEKSPTWEGMGSTIINQTQEEIKALQLNRKKIYQEALDLSIEELPSKNQNHKESQTPFESVKDFQIQLLRAQIERNSFEITNIQHLLTIDKLTKKLEKMQAMAHSNP